MMPFQLLMCCISVWMWLFCWCCFILHYNYIKFQTGWTNQFESYNLLKKRGGKIKTNHFTDATLLSGRPAQLIHFLSLFFFYQPTQYAKGTHYDNRLSDSLLAITTSMLIIPTQI